MDNGLSIKDAERATESQMCYCIRAVHIGRLQAAFEKMDAFKAKWPKDYKNRIGYNADEVVKLAREIITLMPKLDALGNHR